MVFSSPSFLFAFLPLVLIGVALLRSTRARNLWLLSASLFFYFWGEQERIVLLGVSIGVCGLLGQRLHNSDGAERRRWLFLGVGLQLALLAFFKYANFAVENVNAALGAFALGAIPWEGVALPIGISFFTFQAITYLVDVTRGVAPARLPRAALFVALFPQLIAGPIVRYSEIAEQLAERTIRRADVLAGLQRFVLGLAKKVLIANTLAVPADAIFALPVDERTPLVAWLGIAAFSLQIYFDFSGYSDMAIGLGRILGFRFPENFDGPYGSRSIREFWRRWHMTLSRFFRDYVYIPMGGNRRGTLRTGLHLLAVFGLCGLWHGASWNFLLWGLAHGALLALERTRLGSRIAALPRIVQHAYVVLAVMGTWVLFRADDLSGALHYYAALVGWGDAAGPAWAVFWNREVALALCVGVLLSQPAVAHWLRARLASVYDEGAQPAWGVRLLGLASLQALFWLSVMTLVAGAHNPFIYFRF